MRAPAGTIAAVLGLLFTTPAPAQKDPARNDKDKDPAARREQQHEFLLGQARTAMLVLPQTAQWNEADASEQGLLLRALLCSRIGPDDERIRAALHRWLRLDMRSDLLARSERIWILVLTREDDASGDLRRLVDDVCAEQEADGAFNAAARKAPDAERILVTGRVLEALAAAERLAVSADAKVWQRALGFLIAAQASDGGYPAGPRANGVATARALAGLLAAVARAGTDPRRNEGLQAAARAEKWLVQAYRPDRNPGSRRGTYEWLGALEVAMTRAWLVRAEDHELAEEVFRFLQGAQLTSAGWNEEHLAALAPRPGPGGSAGGGARSAGGSLVEQDGADVGDTAWAALYLARPTRLPPRDEAVGAEHRLAALGRPGATAEDGAEFAARARQDADAVLPILLEGLTAETVLVRRVANAALRALSGKDMGFAPQGTAAANAGAIARWRDWARTR